MRILTIPERPYGLLFRAHIILIAIGWEGQNWNLRAKPSPTLIPQPSSTASRPEFLRGGLWAWRFVNFTSLRLYVALEPEDCWSKS